MIDQKLDNIEHYLVKHNKIKAPKAKKKKPKPNKEPQLIKKEPLKHSFQTIKSLTNLIRFED